MSCNIVKEYVECSRKNIIKYVRLIMEGYYNKDIFYSFLDKYIDIRYYNIGNCSKKNRIDKITSELDIVYNDIDGDKNVAKFMLELFKIIYCLDDVVDIKDKNKLINELVYIREKKLGLNDEKFSEEFNKLIRENRRRKDKFLESFDCEDFKLIRRKILNSDIYDIRIGYKFLFPKLYSDYAINKVYNTSIVAEDKLFIEYYLVGISILRDIIKGNFVKHYLLEYNVGLLKKKEKNSRLLNIIDNDITKDLISFKIKYSDFVENKDMICDYIKKGYKYSVIIDDSFVYKDSCLSIFELFEYVIIDKKNQIHKKLDNLNNVILI